jgi:hypothetical protein
MAFDQVLLITDGMIQRKLVPRQMRQFDSNSTWDCLLHPKRLITKFSVRSNLLPYFGHRLRLIDRVERARRLTGERVLRVWEGLSCVASCETLGSGHDGVLFGLVSQCGHCIGGEWKNSIGMGAMCGMRSI